MVVDNGWGLFLFALYLKRKSGYVVAYILIHLVFRFEMFSEIGWLWILVWACSFLMFI
jgi:hypothetical protein